MLETLRRTLLLRPSRHVPPRPPPCLSTHPFTTNSRPPTPTDPTEATPNPSPTYTMSDPQARLQAAVTTSMDKLDRAYIRKLSMKAYTCMAKCHDQSSYNSQDIQQCVGSCSVALQEVNALIGNELQYFQNRLQRCQQSCEDEVRDAQAKAGGGKPDPSQQQKLQGVYDKCVGKCVDSHLPLVNAMESKLAGECKKRL